jgi:magnesium transporter
VISTAKKGLQEQLIGKDLLHRLLVAKYIPLYAQDEDIVEDLSLATEQSIEACRSHIKSIASIRDSHATIASNNLNRSMQILTAATVLIALPNVFYGMYGMNIPLPFQTDFIANPIPFISVVGLTIILLVILFVIGRNKKFF